MALMRARDSTRTPMERMRSPPGWKAFSTAMPAPTRVAPESRTSSMRPWRAAPLAKKSSMRSTRSPGPRNFLDTMISYTRPWVKDSTWAEYTSPAMFLVLFFLAKSTGTPNCWATTQAMPMPEASMVRIFVTWSSANSRAHSLPISAKSSTSIWWLRKLSTFNTSSPSMTPSSRMRCSNSFTALRSSLFSCPFPGISPRNKHKIPDILTKKPPLFHSIFCTYLACCQVLFLVQYLHFRRVINKL